ncbi:hypothetical protein [Sphingopyxis macrogoltabida]|uniref:Uncharacterized protein n=1 Tax=Sphingopyxis macrogoltabida TaxID=33050 RepID=A0AAC8Z290_SPHMC|nr:hypothetical protein [Sphingopyxis macrogoltabida]ALJ14235.1 hypothetical protein LH19_15300 [Sphingopyxis macrogoltabida]AMU90501.1 hypothetical protein ATM17_15875 [Sphingopyxis macrogoltabida]
MPKARATNQLAFAFEAPRPATHAAALAGMDAEVARTVGEVLATAQANGKPREIAAAEMSVLLNEPITFDMLNAWSAPGKGKHNISFTRMCALVAVTNRFDLLDRELRRIGAAVIVGKELMTVRAGHLRAVIRKNQEELRELERLAPQIGEEREI